MAKLRIPKGDGFKVFGGEGAQEQAAADDSQENTTLADTATALLEGGGDEGDEYEPETTIGDDENQQSGIGLPREGWHPEDAAGIDNGEVGDDLPNGHHSAEVSLVLRVPADDGDTMSTYELSHVDKDSVIAKGEFFIPGPLKCYLVITVDGKETITLVNFEAGVMAEQINEVSRAVSYYEVLEEAATEPLAEAIVAVDGEQPAPDADQPVVGETAVSLDVGELPASEVSAIAAATDLQPVTEAMRLRLQRAQSIREWQQNCEDAKEKFVAAALAHAELKAATKIAKAEEEDTMETYAKLMGQNPDAAYSPTNAPMNTRPVAEVPTEQASSDATTLVDNGEAAASDTPAGQSSPDAWRTTPISCLSSLTPKLIERLEEAGLTTMGKLEDHRAKIALGHEKWPKGIGEVKITAIEDAIIDWLNENRDKHVFAELSSGAMGEVAEDQPADGVTGEDDAANYVDGQAEGHESAAKQAAVILARAAEINDGNPDSLSEKIVDAGYWEQGWSHHQNGEKLETCEWSASAAQDDFIRGYLSAAKADGYGTINQSDVAAAAEQPAPTDLDLVDLDNL